ncbi:AD domain-containing protein [Caenorhabditis elegans]|uniref:AD domain-containing protein n=1 Tax=Caenorhabditis elegans TaxID=6239 RepID=Q21541_CAEEL|nr:AD domain-containing protein [Caenorhabditis elegans]CAA97808.2 AD domain-containing protein [Caenorhabditis elegans]|eukprot:NP_499402.2 Uncharacterized protein CELE_M142.5 [Caenorhabditis elegans]
MASCNLTASNVAIGACVEIETTNGLSARGVVISFDTTRKVLVLDTKEMAINKPMIRIFNSEHLKNIKVLSEALEESEKFARAKTEQFAQNNPVNGTRTTERLDKTLGELTPNLMKSPAISIRGQQAYLQLKRTIPDTCWCGEDIRVLGLVLVHKPYEVSDVTKDAKATGFDESRAESAVLQVQKILSKPMTEYTARAPLDFTIGAIVAN